MLINKLKHIAHPHAVETVTPVMVRIVVNSTEEWMRLSSPVRLGDIWMLVRTPFAMLLPSLPNKNPCRKGQTSRTGSAWNCVGGLQVTARTDGLKYKNHDATLDRNAGLCSQTPLRPVSCVSNVLSSKLARVPRAHPPGSGLRIGSWRAPSGVVPGSGIRTSSSAML